MSSSNAEGRAIAPETPPEVGAVASACRNLTVTGINAIAFWFAILLPFPILAMLYGGLVVEHTQVFFGLLASHATCLFVGHRYRPENRTHCRQ